MSTFSNFCHANNLNVVNITYYPASKDCRAYVKVNDTLSATELLKLSDFLLKEELKYLCKDLGDGNSNGE